MNDCVKLLKYAKRPIMLLGGGIHLSRARDEAEGLAILLGIPVVQTWNALDVLPFGHPLNVGNVGTFGGPGRNFAIQNCDLLLSIGSRISGRITGGLIETFARFAKKIIVDIDQDELDAHEGYIKICSDAKGFITTLSEALKDLPDWSGWLNRCQGWKEKYRPWKESFSEGSGKDINPYYFIKALSDACGEGDIIIHDCGGNTIVTCQTFETKRGQRLISDNGHSAMGYALSAAIGAQFAAPDKRVVCIIGDGGFDINVQELSVIKHHNLPIKVFVLNNHGYGITRMFQDTNFEGRYEACDEKSGLWIPDLVKVSQSYGIPSWYMYCFDEIAQQSIPDSIKTVLMQNYPVVCVVDCGDFHDYRPRLGWHSPIEDQYPFLAREEFRSNMIVEPIEGWETPIYP